MEAASLDALRDSERRYRRLFESIGEAVFMTDASHVVLDCNDAALRVFGRSREDLIGSSAAILYDDEADLEALAAPLATVSERLLRDATMVRSNGSRFDAELTLYPTHSPGAESAGWLVLVRDVTALRQDQRVVAESEALLRQVLEILPVGVWIADEAGTLTLGNAAARRIWEGERHVGPEGYGEYKGWWADTGAPIGASDWALARAIRKGETSTEERVRIQCFDGSTKLILNSAVPIRDDAGRICGAIVVNQDITERDALQQQFLQAQKMEAVGRLAGGVAHDFNNLLGVISGYGEMVQRGLAEGSRERMKLAHVLAAAERGAALTRQLLAFSRRQVLEPTDVDLNQVIAEMEPLLRRLIGEDVELVTRLGSGVGAVRADRGQIEQVVMNLAVNARDAMVHGGRLEIETGEGEPAVDAGASSGHDRWVALTVIDNGHGMDEATRARVFEPFFTTKDPGKGTGLGLATVYGIVQQARGHISLETAPGCGARFRINLPRVDRANAVATSQPSPDGAIPTGDESLLLVEDEESLRGVVHEILAGLGYSVMVAGNSLEALALAAGHTGQLHALITDVVMPGGGGRALAEQLCAARPGLKVLYVSGYTDDAIMHHGVRQHEMNFLNKPFSADVLARRVREVLDAPVPS
ncbi:MAG: PAS domain S-box protein [Vicinamibacteria bacterium]|nr:PAS domain S-box protein [Vicinamibacteria bacterium]